MVALILTCGTGGGHDAAAFAIEEELTRRGIRAVILNPYRLYSRILEEKINHSYVSLVQNCPVCFGLIYKLGEIYRNLPFHSPVYKFNRKMVQVMEKYLSRNHFDVIIMTHLFAAEIMTQMKNEGINIPKTILVVTDYTCIPFTEETNCDAYVIPDLDLTDEFSDRGIPKEKIYPLGIPTRLEFTYQVSKELSRKKLGIENSDRFILISGGSIGAGKIEEAIQMLLAQCSFKIKLAVICGNNKRVYARLSEKYGDSIRIIQSTMRMADYIRACDLYLTKPGGLSSTEAAAVGVPLVHLPPIPGCETKNAEFFYQHKISLRIRKVNKDMMQTIALMKDPLWKAEMIRNQKRIIRRNSASKICDLALQMISQF